MTLLICLVYCSPRRSSRRDQVVDDAAGAFLDARVAWAILKDAAHVAERFVDVVRQAEVADVHLEDFDLSVVGPQFAEAAQDALSGFLSLFFELRVEMKKAFEAHRCRAGRKTLSALAAGSQERRTIFLF